MTLFEFWLFDYENWEQREMETYLAAVAPVALEFSLEKDESVDLFLVSDSLLFGEALDDFFRNAVGQAYNISGSN